MKTSKHHMLVCLAAACVVLAAICTVATAPAQIFRQDLTIHSTTTGSGMMGKGASTTKQTDYYSKNAMKTSSSDGTDTIIRFDQEKVISIDNKNRTYSEITFKKLQEMINQAAAEMAEMKEDAEAMAMMKKMMGGASGSFSVTKEGPGEQIAGYATQKYRIRGPFEMEIWVAPDLKIPAAYYDVMKIRAPANPMFDMSKMYEEMKKIEGIPMKTVMSMKMMGMEMKTTQVVTSVEKGPVPASVFEIPAGYKLVPFK